MLENSPGVDARGEEPGGLTMSLRTMAYDMRLTGALDKALALARAAVRTAAGVGSIGDVTRGTALLGRISHDLGDSASAETCFARTRTMGDQTFARRTLWEAEVLFETGAVKQARAIAEENLQVLQALGWRGHCAHAHTLLGLIALAQGQDASLAQWHLERARVWTARSGEVEVVLRCHELAARVALCEGCTEDANEELRRGSTLAELCGVGLYSGRFAAVSPMRGTASRRLG